MRTGTRRALLAGATVAVGGFVVALLAFGGDGDGAEPAATTSTTRDRTTLTTVDLVPSSTAAPAASETTVAGPAPGPESPVLTAEGAVLAPAGGTRRQADGDCQGLALEGYEARCGTAGSGSEQLAWLIEESSETGGLRASILRPRGAGEWEVLLAVADDGPDGPTRFRAISAVAADISDDGRPEIVVGFRDQGSSGILEVDVVEVPGRVAVHRAWELGEAVATGGRLDGWAASFGPGDARCCPSAWIHEVIGVAGGSWRLLTADDEQRSAPPDGQFE